MPLHDHVSRDVTCHVTAAVSRGRDVEDGGDHDARAAGDDPLVKHASLVLERLDVPDVITARVCRCHMHYTHTTSRSSLLSGRNERWPRRMVPRDESRSVCRRDRQTNRRLTVTLRFSL